MAKSYIGCHIGLSKCGITGTVEVAKSETANFFQIFLKSPQSTKGPRHTKKKLEIVKNQLVDNDIKVCGVILNKNTNGSLELNKSNKGAIWVCNKNGNLSNGEYISSSSVQGYGQKQILNEELKTKCCISMKKNNEGL